jgi:putative flippase GtrA
MKQYFFISLDKMNTQAVRYLLVGVLGLIIELLLFSLFYRLGLGIILGNLLSFQIALTVCFMLHYRYTYRVLHKSFRDALNYYFKYTSLMYIQALIGTVLLYGFIEFLLLQPELAKIIQIAIVTPISYIYQKTKIFHVKTSG